MHRLKTAFESISTDGGNSGRALNGRADCQFKGRGSVVMFTFCGFIDASRVYVDAIDMTRFSVDFPSINRHVFKI